MKYWFRVTSLIMVMVICISLVCSSVGAVNINFISNDDKIDRYLNDKLKTVSQDELIPVHIWYKDIDQDLIEDSVERECGFSKEEIALDYEMPSVELITSYKNGDISAISEMSNYMQRTENSRIKEKERTDEYIITRRNISKLEYIDKSYEMSRCLDISEDRIEFRSEYAPTLIARLNKNEIERLIKDNSVENIGYYFPVECTDTEVTDSIVELERDVSKIVQVNDTLGLTGKNVKIGMFEGYHPDLSHDSIDNANIINRNNGFIYRHATDVARVMVGDSDGVAKDAILYSARNSQEFVDQKTVDYSQFEWLLSQGVSVINMSYGYLPETYVSGYGYSFHEMWIDHLVSYHNVTFVVAAGNFGSIPIRLDIPALAHNVISVGAYNTKLTPETSDDSLSAYSSWANSRNVENFEYRAIEKPDVILPGSITRNDVIGKTLEEIMQEENDGDGNDNENETYISNGTSYAAPMLTGSIALMLELKPSLTAFPQAIKAIVLASSHRKVGRSGRYEATETLEEGITECQGAGVPDVWTMACIISQGSYGVGVLDGQQNTCRFYQPNYNASKMNVSLCWLREDIVTDEVLYDENSVIVGPYVNLDLYVNCNGVQHTSLNTHSSTEMAYFDLDNNNHMYEIEIKRNSGCSEPVRYGYAYSTNESYFGTVSNDGIYKVKNLLTQEYLTLNPSNNELIMQEYSNLESKQDWILKSNSVGGWNITSGNASTQGAVAFGDSYDTNNKKIELSNETVGFSLFSWESMNLNQDYGAFRFYTRTGADAWYIGCDDDNALLSKNNSSLLSSYWILEKQNYRLGDANTDGNMNVFDKTTVQSYLAHSISLDNKQVFLADVNGDGVISVLDVTSIEQIIM